MCAESLIIKEDNLGDLPEKKAVYAIFDNGFNCIYVGQTKNLRQRMTEHFSENEKNECLRKFMQSDNEKVLTWEILDSSDEDERLEKEKEWIKRYNPKCKKISNSKDHL